MKILKDINCDICLLDFNYGNLQLQLAESLYSQTKNKLDNDNDYSSKCILEKNELFKNILKDIWINYPEEERSREKMLSDTVRIVNPCQGAYTMWMNWSII